MTHKALNNAAEAGTSPSNIKLTKEQMADAKALCIELPLLEARLRRAGLTATAQALNVAVQRIGFEVSEKSPY